MVSELHRDEYNRIVGWRHEVTALIGKLRSHAGVSLAAEIESLQAVTQGLDAVLDEMEEADEEADEEDK